MYKLTKNFSWEEFYESPTAKAKHIDNTPNEDVRKNIYNLAAKILQPIREAFGKPIVISSGYRCFRLNSVVGGASNSDHLYGAAADIRTVSNSLKDNKELWDVINKLVKEGKISCRQVIWEYGTKVGPLWVHVSVNHSKNTKKNNQMLYIGVKCRS